MRGSGRRSRVVVDTNQFVSGLISKLGQPHQLVEHFYRGAFRLLVTEPLIQELDEVLHRPRFSARFGLTDQERDQFLAFVASDAVRVTPRRRLPLSVRDPKDEKVVAAALGGGADYLVTGDEDLLVLDGDPRLGSLRIITVQAFLEQLPYDDWS